MIPCPVCAGALLTLLTIPTTDVPGARRAQALRIADALFVLAPSSLARCPRVTPLLPSSRCGVCCRGRKNFKTSECSDGVVIHSFLGLLGRRKGTGPLVK